MKITDPTNVSFKPSFQAASEVEVGGIVMRRLPRQVQFVAFFHFVSWTALAFGVSFHLNGPHIEIHLPFGLVRIGFVVREEAFYPPMFGSRHRSWGLRERYHA